MRNLSTNQKQIQGFMNNTTSLTGNVSVYLNWLTDYVISWLTTSTTGKKGEYKHNFMEAGSNVSEVES